MKTAIRLSVISLLFTAFAVVSAVAGPNADAAADADAIADSLPWSRANSFAEAAAIAYSNAYSEAIAIAHPDPEAYALAASADDCASIGCHASCGLLIIEGQKCSTNDENSYSGPYNTTCLCPSDTSFMKYYAPCMNCGWTLWKYYGGYVSSALAACGTLSTEPTGTLRCSTTLTDVYSIDTGLQACEYTGNCPTETTTSETSAPAVVSTSVSSSVSSETSQSSPVTTSTEDVQQEKYTVTTHTVETDLSYSYSYQAGGSSTDCFTTVKTVSDDGLSLVSTSWYEQIDDPSTGKTTYKLYLFVNFTEDYDDVTDIQFFTDAKEQYGSVAQFLEPSDFYVNLKQGAYVVATASKNTIGASTGVVMVEKAGKKYILSYSCSTTRLTLTVIIFPDGFKYDKCLAIAGGYMYESQCVHQQSVNTLVEFRPKKPTSSSSDLSGSSHSVEASSVSESVGSSSVESSSVELSSRESSSIESSSMESSSRESSSMESSSVEPSSMEPSSMESSSVEPSSMESLASTYSTSLSSMDQTFTMSSSESSDSTETEMSSSSTEISTSSSSSISTNAPLLTGSYEDGAISWTLEIPGSLGPWESVEITFSKDKVNNNGFLYTTGKAFIDEDSTIPVDFTSTSESVYSKLSDAIPLDSVLSLRVNGGPVDGNAWTSFVHIVITTDEGQRLVKGAQQTWDLAYTITDLENSSSFPSSDISSSDIFSSDVYPTDSVTSSSDFLTSESQIASSLFTSSMIAPYANVTTTSISTIENVSSTVVTVTSCLEDSCVTREVITGVTVVTAEENGTVKLYTTYCPLTTETEIERHVSTTIIIVESCEDNVCTEAPVTAGWSVVTTTTSAMTTSYTTYFPIATEGPTGTIAVTETEYMTNIHNQETPEVTRGDDASFDEHHESAGSKVSYETPTVQHSTAIEMYSQGTADHTIINTEPNGVHKTSKMIETATDIVTQTMAVTSIVTKKPAAPTCTPTPQVTLSMNESGGSPALTGTAPAKSSIVEEQGPELSKTRDITTVSVSTFEGVAERISNSLFTVLLLALVTF